MLYRMVVFRTGRFGVCVGWLSAFLWKLKWVVVAIGTLAATLAAFLTIVDLFPAYLPKKNEPVVEKNMNSPTYQARQEIDLTAVAIEFDFSDTRFSSFKILHADFSTEPVSYTHLTLPTKA